jgi:GH15 family glucan-1,4-alpha-glucosidase
MPRDLPLANGHLLVNFDANYDLRDLYWPHIGERNHTEGHVSRFGVWVEGAFTWLDAPEWQRDLRYELDTLITHVTLTHPGLRLKLECSDAVDFDRDLFIRKARVTNLDDHSREVRLFYHHDWHLWENEGANTAYYAPSLRALVAYKDRCNVLVNGLVGDERAGGPQETREAIEGVRHWATGYKEFNAQQGTWRDAEDGVLEGNPIAQGSVDSCVGFHLGVLDPQTPRCCYSWLAFAPDYRTLRALNALVMRRGPESFLTRTRDYWHLWLTAKPVEACDLPEPLIELYKRSLLLIRTQIDADGAIIAATDGDVWAFARDSYAYMWPRDGSLVANVLSHAGYGDITGAFFDFCRRMVTDEGYLLHKYTPAGNLGSSWQPWVDKDGHPTLPIQEDETALVLYALWQHYTLFHEVEFIRPLYRPLVVQGAEFLVSYRDPETKLPKPSWDLWEERRGVHAYTLGAVYAGLMAAANFAEAFGEGEAAARYRQAAQELKDATRQYLWHNDEGRFVRTLYVEANGGLRQDLTLDASISGLYQFGMFEATSDEMRRTMAAITERLMVKTEVSGVARYENDYYHQVSQDLGNVPGNPWFICACWLAEYQIACAQTLEELRQAQGWLEWVRARALSSGVLAEQVNPYTDAPLSVSPLTWSHAEYAGAIRWYIGKYRHLTSSAKQ